MFDTSNLLIPDSPIQQLIQQSMNPGKSIFSQLHSSILPQLSKEEVEHYLKKRFPLRPVFIYKYELLGHSLSLASNPLIPSMVQIEGGTFDLFEEFEVSMDDFEIGIHPVTQSQWEKLMGTNPSEFQGQPDAPVESVSWDDCQGFLDRLNEETELEYRLPTEAEWTFAAKGGKKSKGYVYAGSNDLDEVGWYGHNSGGTTHPVAQLKPNELGLYDMAGNVWEWCQDWKGSVPESPQKNYQGAESGRFRIMKGGGWKDSEQGCQLNIRSVWIPRMTSNYLGLRIARSL